jgi:thiol-disulfide isomerase/thioredoxin
MRRAVYVLLTIAVAAIVVVGLMQASDSTPERQRAGVFDIDAALASLSGAPAPLAALHAQAGQLLPESVPAFRARLKALRGHPIVINKWGSWCGPCRTEFPVFQRVSTKLGKQVAFLGIDGADPLDGARNFLKDFPIPYPSYRDPSGSKLAAVVEADAVGFPMTVFVDRAGKVVTTKAGEYVNDDQLRADIRRYLGV